MSLRISLDRTEAFGTLVTTRTSRVIDLSKAQTLSIQAVIDVNTASAALVAAASVDATANTFTKTAHGFTTGLKGQWTTSSALPAGLSTSTDYFVIVVDADTFKVATSLANAQAGTAVDITTQGTGNHTFTPTALAGGAIKLQKSNLPATTLFASTYTYNSAHWSDVASATAVTTDATVFLDDSDIEYRAAIVHFTLTAGSADVTLYEITKE